MRTFSLSALLTIGSLLPLASGAIAQTVTPTDPDPVPPGSQPTIDVPFEGEVEFACSFDIPEPGTLTPIGLPIAEVLTSLESPGTSGQVNILCNAESNLVVEPPVQTDGPSVVVTAEESLVDSPFGDTSSSGTPLTLPAGAFIPLTVDMSVRAADASVGFPPGTYRYKVTLIVTP